MMENGKKAHQVNTESAWGGGDHSPSVSGSTGQSSGCTLAAYADAKRLPIDFLTGLGLTEFTYCGSKAIRIPYRDGAGVECATRFRVNLSRGEQQDDRFRWKQGAKPLLYGLERLANADDSVVIVEGESDCHTLWFHGVPAVGLPGAGLWNESRDAGHFDNISTIYVVLEPDTGADAVKRWLATSAIRDRVRLVTINGFKDPSALHVADDRAFKERWAEAVAASVPWPDYESSLLDAARREAREAAAPLAAEHRILERFVADIRRVGLVGEEKGIQLLYLALTSRVLSKPVSVAIKGPSSAGKSYTTDTVLSFFPESAYEVLTGMSEHALAYGEEPLAHRFLVICEAAGMDGEIASYLVRTLLSEGHIRYQFVEKTSEGLHTRTIEREGPTGLLVTTTKTGLHPENETRLLSLTVTDTQEQTKAVLRALAANRKDSIDRSPWHALQEWLALCPNDVEIPYVERLAELVPPVAVRLRRDFGAVLNLIRAHALLHQATRERDADGRIVATIEDYRIVRDVVSDLVAEGVEATVPASVREAVDAVAGLTFGDVPTTKKAVAERLNIDPGAAWRRLHRAIVLGYVRNEEDRKGRPAKLVLGDSLPEEICVLPPPALLADEAVTRSDCTIDGDSEGVSTPTPHLDSEIAIISTDDADASGWDVPWGEKEDGSVEI